MGRRFTPSRCCKGGLSTTMRDRTDAHRGGVMKSFTFLQIERPVRTLRCTTVRGGRAHAGAGTSSSPDPVTGASSVTDGRLASSVSGRGCKAGVDPVMSVLLEVY